MKKGYFSCMLLLIALVLVILFILPGDSGAAGSIGKSLLSGNGLLLIPDCTNGRVMGFDPQTGNLLDAGVIPSDSHLEKPIHAVLSAGGNSILVSDFALSVVYEFDFDGNYLGIFAPSGGANSDIFKDPFGIMIDPNGHLLVTNTEGANGDSVAEFGASGVLVKYFVDHVSGGLDHPHSIIFRTGQSDFLVSGNSSWAIHRYDIDGNSLGELATIEEKPEQIALAANGNVLVANYDGTQEGIVELTSTGTLVGVYNPPGVGGCRGVYELPNGNILTTNQNGVYEIGRSGNLVETKLEGVDARYIQFVKAVSRNGFWTAEGETGTAAMIIAIEGDLMAFAWGAFNTDTGAPTWIFARAPKIDTNTYSGALLEFAGGPSFTSGPKALTKIESIGTIVVTFSSNTTATISGNVRGVNFEKNISKSPFE